MNGNGSGKICLYGGPLYDGRRLLPRGLVVFDAVGIETVDEGAVPPAGTQPIDVGGRLIAPGLVDLHSDALEKCIEMRPGVMFDALFALQNLDHRLAACGITTFCHAVSFADSELGLRSATEAERLVGLLSQFNSAADTLIDHRIHARFEVGSAAAANVLKNLLEKDLVELVSIMDHSAGQGQFRSLEAFVHYYASTYAMGSEQIMELARRKENGRGTAWRQAVALTDQVRRRSLPLLSHDDDSAEKISLVRGLGATAAEFPVTLEAARSAHSQDLRVFMGAPNLLRGSSSSGHLKAADTIRAGLCSGLLSDYYPESLIQAPFIAHRRLRIDLAAALSLVSSQPGAFLEPNASLGLLQPGGPADCLVIATDCPWVRVLQTWKNGRLVYQRAG